MESLKELFIIFQIEIFLVPVCNVAPPVTNSVKVQLCLKFSRNPKMTIKI